MSPVQPPPPAVSHSQWLMMNFLADTALGLGEVERATRHTDGARSESVTTHQTMLTWVACDLATLRAPNLPRVNTGRVAELVSVHDILERWTGDRDTFGLTAEGLAEKAWADAEALERLLGRFPNGSWMAAAVSEYEQQLTLPARWVRYVDKLMPRLTHCANACAVFVERGTSVAEVRRHQQVQGARLRDQYPDLADLHPIYDFLSAMVEQRLDLELTRGLA